MFQSDLHKQSAVEQNASKTNTLNDETETHRKYRKIEKQRTKTTNRKKRAKITNKVCYYNLILIEL